jgi:spermidine synthase
VTAVEIEPQIAALSRQFFALPASVDIRLADARAFLLHDPQKYDLIFLDTFASESTAWHLMTAEAMRDIRARLNTRGRLVVNTVAYARGDDSGLRRLEATMASKFAQVLVYPQRPVTDDPDELINVTLIGGEQLEPRMLLPATQEGQMTMLAQLIHDSRPAARDAVVMTDDRSDLDYVQAPLRVRWRTLIWAAMDSNLLWD